MSEEIQCGKCGCEYFQLAIKPLPGGWSTIEPKGRCGDCGEVRVFPYLEEEKS